MVRLPVVGWLRANCPMPFRITHWLFIQSLPSASSVTEALAGLGYMLKEGSAAMVPMPAPLGVSLRQKESPPR